MWRKIGIGFIILFVAVQLIRPIRNAQSKALAKKNDISTLYKIPYDVSQILKKSCNDCYSSNTEYPWYSNFQPFGWWMQFHVDEGKLELNFNQFAAYPAHKQRKKLKEIAEEIKTGKMPLPSYLWLHKNAKLNQQEKQIMNKWVQATTGEIVF
jgi:hypothetical protein